MLPPDLLPWLTRQLRLWSLVLAIVGLSPLMEALERALPDTHAHTVAEVVDEGDCDDLNCHGDVHHCGCCISTPRLPLQRFSLLSAEDTLTATFLAAPLRPTAPLLAWQPTAPTTGPSRALAPPWLPPRHDGLLA